MTSRRPFSLAGLGLVMAVALTTGDPAAASDRNQSAPPPPQAPATVRNGNKIRVVGTVKDQQNSIALPGVVVEVTGTTEVAVTDVDGRYSFDLAPGSYELKVSMDAYQEQRIKLDIGADRTPTVDVAMVMQGLTESVTVEGRVTDADSSSAEAQMIERKNATVITDNMGSQEMRRNGDSDAAAAMSRVTGLSVVDNQYVFVRGLGERYSNTTLAGSVLPTTEPDKKVVPLDLFPTGLIDSVQIAKSYSPDKSAEFAGGLVQIVPLKLPSRPVFDLSYGVSFYTTATGKDIPLSPLGNRDWLGYDDGARELPGGIPNSKIVRRGIYTPDAGFDANAITGFGRLLNNTWRPSVSDGAPGQNWGAVFGDRFGKLGVIASVTQSYKEQYVEEERRFFRVGDSAEDLEDVSAYDMQFGTQKAQIGIVGNVAYQFSPSHRLAVENFYTHSGRDEGRTFQGPNTENNFEYLNYRLQYIEEGLFSNAVAGEHFFQGLSNSRVDWRVNTARAKRDEPDLREMLYQRPLNSAANVAFTLADESQSAFRMFNNLDDETMDVSGNWSLLTSARGRPTLIKFGVNYIDRSRDFQSRRFRFIPSTIAKDGPVVGPNGLPLDLTQAPEQLYASENIGVAFRFNEETRPVDAYDGDQTTTAIYGMGDLSLSGRARLIAGVRVERFDQEVNTFDPFGLFTGRLTAENKNTDVFPGVNFVYALQDDMNLRMGYSTTVNRPEFRELAAFEFTDVVGSRAVRGNPDLNRALIQNVDGRWELFGNHRGVIAASVFYKYFDAPIERVVVAGAQPIVTFQNADSARNFGIELEVGRQIMKNVFVNANYTFVDSRITLSPEQRTVQTSLERPLAGQSKHLFNIMGEYAVRGFSARLLYNYFGDRISDVGSNQAPDIIEEGRGLLDLVFSQRLGNKLSVRLSFENVTDNEWLFRQGETINRVEGTGVQRAFHLGRTVQFSLGYSLF
jgi:outer membrane receptor protein involved in Fe transport